MQSLGAGLRRSLPRQLQGYWVAVNASGFRYLGFRGFRVLGFRVVGYAAIAKAPMGVQDLDVRIWIDSGSRLANGVDEDIHGV